jgi:hypothetical protein
MYKKNLLTLCCCSFFLVHFSQTVPSIDGWSLQQISGTTVFSPNTANTDSKILIYQVRPALKISQPGKGWFLEAVAADMEKEQWTEPVKGAENATTDFNIYMTEIANAAGQRRYVCYMGYLFGGNKARLARVEGSKDPAFFQSNTLTASKHFGSFASKEIKGGYTQAETPAVTKAAPVVPPAPIIKKTSIVKTKMPAINTVIMHLEYEVGMGGGIYPVYNAYVLFKDGSIYKYPELCLDDIDMSDSKLTEPRKWGTWKKNNQTLLTYWPAEKPKEQNEEWEQKSYYTVQPAQKDEKLEGDFKTISGGGNTALGGEVMVVSAANIVFGMQGKFSIARTAGVSSGRDFWENNSGSSSETGTYKLDNYSIEFKYNNGKTERRFFYFYPDSRKHFGIGNSVYMPKRK